MENVSKWIDDFQALDDVDRENLVDCKGSLVGPEVIGHDADYDARNEDHHGRHRVQAWLELWVDTLRL